MGAGERPLVQVVLRGQFRGGIRHKPSKPSMLGDSSLAQLREDDADEVESNCGALGVEYK
jgi:hypothetical protein